MSFIKILLIIFILVILGLCGLYLGIRYLLPWWLKRKVAQYMSETAEDSDARLPFSNMEIPARAHLKTIPIEDLDSCWHHPTVIAALIQEAKLLGFIDLGGYCTNELYWQSLNMMTHPDHGLWLMITDTRSDTTFKMTTLYTDETYCTVTTAPDIMPVADTDRRWFKPGYSLNDTLDFLLSERKTASIMAVTTDNICAIFYDQYAKAFDYLVHTDQFCLSEYALSEEVLASAQLAESTAELRDNISSEISNAVLDNFMRSNTMNAADWNRYKNRLFVIHERSHSDELWDGYFDDYIEIKKPQKKENFDFNTRTAKLSQVEYQHLEQLYEQFAAQPLACFKALNAALPQDKMYALVARVDYPLAAEIYRDRY